MVSLDEVQKNFKSFVNKVSDRKDKKLKKEDIMSLSVQIKILSGLLDGKGFISQVERLEKIRKSILKNGLVGKWDIDRLKEILASIL